MCEPRIWLAKIRGNRLPEEVAELAGISRSAYVNIERGNRNPSVQMAKKIASALAFDWTIFFENKRFKTEQSHTA